MKSTPDFRASLAILKRDARLAPLIKKFGPPDLSRYHGRIGVFEALIRSIIYQQISGKAAASIHRRVVGLYPRNRPTPALVLATPPAKLRAAGLSAQKVAYIKDLAKRFANKEIDTHRFPTMTSAEIVEHLVRIKGVGVWTAHMLLIFTLRRTDILPAGDLAIRRGFQVVYKLKKEPTSAQMEKLAKNWRGHASIASWYFWRVVDDAKKKAAP